MRPDIYNLFTSLDKREKARWAQTVQHPNDEYERRLASRAEKLGCSQERRGDAVAWLGVADTLEVMFFRIPDPGNLAAIRRMFDQVADESCPIAFAFVNQRGDSPDAWDVSLLSRLSYLCHCNRISGPGTSCEA